MNQLPSYTKDLAPGHPIRVYFEENIFIDKVLNEILSLDLKQDYELFFNLFNQLSEIEKKFSRKENQLFPYLEKYGWTAQAKGCGHFMIKLEGNLRKLEH